ncbi:MAG: F0F1 ATP synthase subunit A, partial [Dehalococcoidales bacterium]
MPKRGGLGFPLPILITALSIFFLLLVVGFVSGPLGRRIFGDIGLPQWLSVPRPAPELPPEVVFHLFGFPITNSIIGAWITMVVLVGFSYAITRRMKIVPGRLQSAFEFLLGWLYNLCQRVAGEENGRRFFPVVTTIFLFVAFNAWLSLIPGFGSIEITNAEGHHVHLFRGANTDINMPLALALISFIFVEYFGLKSLGIRYLRKFINVGQFFSSLAHIT